MFYDSLAPYGHWFWLDPYGWVWTPNKVAYGWRPYTEGHWVYSDAGWTWASDLPWGWAPFHYGRWSFDEQYGWVWVPDTVWGPGWVAWNYGNDWCGWAPLPPNVAWQTSPDWDAVIPTFWWCFVPTEFVMARHVHRHIVPVARNVTLLRETRNVTHFESRDGRVLNHHLDPAVIERVARRQVPRVNLVADPQPVAPGARLHGNDLHVFRPDLTPRVSRPATAPVVREHRATAPSVAPAPRLSPTLLQQQDAERRRLAEEQAKEAAKLGRIHQQERARPPNGMPLQNLAERQMSERHALNEQINRQNQLFENRAQRQIRQATPPAATGRGPASPGRQGR